MKISIALLLIVHGFIAACQSPVSFNPAAGIKNPTWLAWWPANLGQSWPLNALELEHSLAVRMVGIFWLIAGAARHLREDGRLFLYGPFKRGGRHTAISNAVFDTSLRSQDAEWGVRDVGDVTKLAERSGLRLAESFEMPSNNLILMFERSGVGIDQS